MDQKCNNCNCNRGCNKDLQNKAVYRYGNSSDQRYNMYDGAEEKVGCKCNKGYGWNKGCGCNKGCDYKKGYAYKKAVDSSEEEKLSRREYNSNYSDAAYVAEAHDCEHLENDEIACMPIAMAYVPWQQWGEVFTGECGLEHGTIFPELVKDFWVSCGLGM